MEKNLQGFHGKHLTVPVSLLTRGGGRRSVSIKQEVHVSQNYRNTSISDLHKSSSSSSLSIARRRSNLTLLLGWVELILQSRSRSPEVKYELRLTSQAGSSTPVHLVLRQVGLSGPSEQWVSHLHDSLHLHNLLHSHHLAQHSLDLLPFLRLNCHQRVHWRWYFIVCLNFYSVLHFSYFTLKFVEDWVIRK